MNEPRGIKTLSGESVWIGKEAEMDTEQCHHFSKVDGEMKHLRNKMKQYVESKKGHITKTIGIKKIKKKDAQKMKSC